MPDPIEQEDITSEVVDIEAWVEAARANPTQYRDRQVAEIVLAAIGFSPSLRDTLVLKGGTAMALAFHSARLTGDLDFTALADPKDYDQLLMDELNAELPRAAIRLGYTNLVCRVQTIKKRPRPQNFEEHNFPALLVKVASATSGGTEEQRLNEGMASQTMEVEITFRDDVCTYQLLKLKNAQVAIRAFTLHEIIAEKLRALLQQPIRKRNRRQDVYDIAYLIDGHELTGDDRERILITLMEKCRTRDIVPEVDSLDDPEVAQRARQDWGTLELELGDLPAFEARFTIVRDLYRSLPWIVQSVEAPSTAA